MNFYQPLSNRLHRNWQQRLKQLRQEPVMFIVLVWAVMLALVWLYFIVAD
ncbi:MAG: hypothetical protein JST84_01070 [Acidobacteria bacterium]|jgi:hypothetical protein|nr:hypothetical protein [Acidobacteriota bacterium]